MKILQSSDYRIYFDDVRMDPYIKNWSASCGLNASDAIASITMYRTRELEEWKGYLTQVRIFSRNVFSGKFGIVFEGEIMNRNWGDQRNDTGELVFSCKGFYHWLDIPIPLMIGSEEDLDVMQRFRYEAQNINVEEAVKFFMSQEELIMKDKYIEEIIKELLKLMNDGYYMDTNSTFHWADLENRFKIMAEIIKEFREAGYIDAFTFTRTTQIETFYVYLNQVLTQLMFEFYQDRDGAFRIKNPSWGDDILKAHILDESVIQSVSGFNDWENEPTRVLVIGGDQDISRHGPAAPGVGNIMHVPMGLYIGKPGEGEFFSQAYEIQAAQFGLDGEIDTGGGGGVGSSTFFDDITDNYRVSSPFGWRTHPISGDRRMHYGTDYATSYDDLRNLGGQGEVISSGFSDGGGNFLVIKQNFGGQRYDFVYLHMSRKDVNQGDILQPGQLIGASGATGRVTGAHLHLEIWEGQRFSGTARDPEKWIPKLKQTAAQTNVSGLPATGSFTPNTPIQDSLTNAASGGSSGGNSASGSGSQAQIMNMDLGAHTNLSVDQLNSWINPRAKSGSKMYNTGAHFKEAERLSGLDATYLVAHAAQETAWGRSNIVQSRNNFYGIAAFDASPYSSSYQYSSASAGIIEGAVWIRERYYDRGQSTLWTMRHSADGTHNYATDPQWPHKIADVMRGAPGNLDTSRTSGTPGMSPNASTTGFNPRPAVRLIEETIRSSTFTQRTTLTPISDSLTETANRLRPSTPVSYSNLVTNNTHNYDLSVSPYQQMIREQPSGVHADLIATIIWKSSNWREKHSDGHRRGLMGVHQDLAANEGVSEDDLFDPQKNINIGTQLFEAARNRFSGKVTFALAGLHTGNLVTVENAIYDTGVEDFSRVRENLPSETVSFVDEVVSHFSSIHNAHYLEGDPHVPVYTGGQIDEDAAWDTDVKRYAEQYKPIMSEEERLYKVNLRVSEQLLIRYDANISVTNPSEQDNMQDRFGDELGDRAIAGDREREVEHLDADELVERYARYMMQLYRAESHGVNVTLSTSLPFLRPGFNAWLEPTRRDLVFYITRVNHQGSFGRGSFSTVNGAYVRDPGSYDNIEDNIFVGKSNARARDFGEVIRKSGMRDIRSELTSLHEGSEQIGDARVIPTLNELYSSAIGEDNDYSTQWSGEYTASEIRNKIDSHYDGAPDVVKNRKKRLSEIVEESADFFREKLLQTDF